MKETKQFALLRTILKAIGLTEARINELVATIQSWLTDDRVSENESAYPYALKETFLSPAELNFYQVLQAAVANWAIVLVKVNLGDLFSVGLADYGRRQAFRNKIDRKHVDFLLCHPHSIQPLLAIELDDSSHDRPDRKERDKFVNGVFQAAQLPLLHVPVKAHYPSAHLSTLLRARIGQLEPTASISVSQPVVKNEDTAVPVCPTCGAPMVLRLAKKGMSTGQSFWGCSRYPQCRGIRQIRLAEEPGI